MKFEKQKRTYDIYGTRVSLEVPSLGQAKKMAESSKTVTEGDEFESMLVYLEELGLERKVALDMTVEHVTELIQDLTGSSKKK